MTEQVAGDDWEVTNLTRPGQRAARPRARHRADRDLEEADLVVSSSGFQPAVDDAVDTVAERRRRRRRRGGRRSRPPTASTQRRARPTTGHDHGDTDPHFWQDPLLMADLADAVADGLAEARPGRRGVVPQERRRRCAPSSRRWTRSSSRAWPTASATPSSSATTRSATSSATACTSRRSPGSPPTPSPRRPYLARLQELIADEGITTVFSERLASPAMAETLASRHGRGDRRARPARGTGRGRRRRATTLLSCSRTSPLSSGPTDAEHRRRPPSSRPAT